MTIQVPTTVWTIPVGDVESAVAARRALEAHLRAQDLDVVLDDLAVMFSELVINALLHGTQPVVAKVVVDADAVRVSVADANPAEPRVLPPDPTRVGGNGMRIVDAWSTEWGVRQIEGDGKDTWFRLDRPSPEGRGHFGAGTCWR